MTDTDEWIEHDGSAWPEGLAPDDHDLVLVVRLRDTTETRNTPSHEGYSDSLQWERSGSRYDIIAYKVIK